MKLVADPHERTTAATDALLALAAFHYATRLGGRHQPDPWKARLWASTFATLGLSGSLGAVAHGVALTPKAKAALWRPLTLSLAVTVALFAVGALRDLSGERVARRALPGLLLAALGFYLISRSMQRGFLAFIVYEALAMLFALAVYAYLARTRRLAGAAHLAVGVLLSIIAAVVQVSSLKLRIAGLPFDHNGLFHLVQLAGLLPIAAGLDASFLADR